MSTSSGSSCPSDLPGGRCPRGNRRHGCRSPSLSTGQSPFDPDRVAIPGLSCLSSRSQLTCNVGRLVVPSRTISALLTARPTTSYFYPSSPGFHWVQSAPVDPSSTAHPNLPAGRWRWSFAGAPSSPDHPLAERQTLLPINWPLVVFASPAALGWVLYVSGAIGEADGLLCRVWLYGLGAVTVAIFFVACWWACD